MTTYTTPKDDPDRDARIKHAKELEKLEKFRTGIILTGRVVNGKVQLDQSALDEIAKKFPDANRSFVAVNAPFDPNPAKA